MQRSYHKAPGSTTILEERRDQYGHVLSTEPVYVVDVSDVCEGHPSAIAEALTTAYQKGRIDVQEEIRRAIGGLY